MYQEYFGLKEKPFTLTPDPQFLYLSDSHRTAIESLLYGIQEKEGFMVMTGEIGTGKTTVCRALLNKIDKNVKTAVIFNSLLTEEELLESILLDFGFSSKGRTKKERIDALNKLLIYWLSQGKRAVLIIDEAQNLSISVLEQIRMLSNLETEKEKLLQIILLGQLELNQKLQSPELKQLNQRVAIRHRLLPLTRMDIERYIYQRLMVAGSQGSITFSRSALDEVYTFSKGSPRLVNLLCDRALLGGFVEQTFRIDRKIIQKAKESLWGEENRPKPFYALSLPKSFISFRIALWTLSLFLLAGIILMNQGDFFQNAKNFISTKIQYVHFQTTATLAMDRIQAQDSTKDKLAKHLEGPPQGRAK